MLTYILNKTFQPQWEGSSDTRTLPKRSWHLSWTNKVLHLPQPEKHRDRKDTWAKSHRQIKHCMTSPADFLAPLQATSESQHEKISIHTPIFAVFWQKAKTAITQPSVSTLTTIKLSHLDAAQAAKHPHTLPEWFCSNHFETNYYDGSFFGCVCSQWICRKCVLPSGLSQKNLCAFLKSSLTR